MYLMLCIFMQKTNCINISAEDLNFSYMFLQRPVSSVQSLCSTPDGQESKCDDAIGQPRGAKVKQLPALLTQLILRSVSSEFEELIINRYLISLKEQEASAFCCCLCFRDTERNIRWII